MVAQGTVEELRKLAGDCMELLWILYSEDLVKKLLNIGYTFN